MSEAKTIISISTPDEGEASYRDLVDVAYEYAKSPWSSLHMMPKERFERLVGEAYVASMQTEEGRAVLLRLLIHYPTEQLTLPFDEPILLSAGNLVKIAPTIMGGSFRWLAVAPHGAENDTPHILGICRSGNFSCLFNPHADMGRSTDSSEAQYPANEGMGIGSRVDSNRSKRRSV